MCWDNQFNYDTVYICRVLLVTYQEQITGCLNCCFVDSPYYACWLFRGWLGSSVRCLSSQYGDPGSFGCCFCIQDWCGVCIFDNRKQISVKWVIRTNEIMIWILICISFDVHFSTYYIWQRWDDGIAGLGGICRFVWMYNCWPNPFTWLRRTS